MHDVMRIAHRGFGTSVLFISCHATGYCFHFGNQWDSNSCSEQKEFFGYSCSRRRVTTESTHSVYLCSKEGENEIFNQTMRLHASHRVVCFLTAEHTLEAAEQQEITEHEPDPAVADNSPRDGHLTAMQTLPGYA